MMVMPTPRPPCSWMRVAFGTIVAGLLNLYSAAVSFSRLDSNPEWEARLTVRSAVMHLIFVAVRFVLMALVWSVIRFNRETDMVPPPYHQTIVTGATAGLLTMGGVLILPDTVYFAAWWVGAIVCVLCSSLAGLKAARIHDQREDNQVSAAAGIVRRARVAGIRGQVRRHVWLSSAAAELVMFISVDFIPPCEHHKSNALRCHHRLFVRVNTST